MINLLEDHKDYKEWNTKSNDNDERGIFKKGNHELIKKVLELKSSLKEK